MPFMWLMLYLVKFGLFVNIVESQKTTKRCLLSYLIHLGIKMRSHRHPQEGLRLTQQPF